VHTLLEGNKGENMSEPSSRRNTESESESTSHVKKFKIEKGSCGCLWIICIDYLSLMGPNKFLIN